MWSSKALHFLINVARIYQQKVISIIWNNDTVLLQYLKLADFSRYFLISLKITIQCFLQYRYITFWSWPFQIGNWGTQNQQSHYGLLTLHKSPNCDLVKWTQISLTCETLKTKLQLWQEMMSKECLQSTSQGRNGQDDWHQKCSQFHPLSCSMINQIQQHYK